jgi:hypothetical protein
VNVRDCKGCGRGFLKGKRVLFPTRDGRLVRTLVCLQCASRAERVVVRVSAKPCMVATCPHAAHVCSHHAAEAVSDARLSALATSISELRAMIAAMRATERRNEAGDFLEGRIEGLEAALEVLERRGTARATWPRKVRARRPTEG